jgi:hypothetical protein
MGLPAGHPLRKLNPFSANSHKAELMEDALSHQ